MAAGEVSLRELTVKRIEQMDQLRGLLQAGLSRASNKHGLPLSVNHHGSCLNLYFSEAAPRSSNVREDGELIEKFHIACMNHGLFIAPRGMIALSTVITEKDIAEAVERADMAMRDVVMEMGNDSVRKG